MAHYLLTHTFIVLMLPVTYKGGSSLRSCVNKIQQVKNLIIFYHNLKVAGSICKVWRVQSIKQRRV